MVVKCHYASFEKLCGYFFTEASVKRHFYYSMKNCNSPDDLRRRLLTVVDHYQVQKILRENVFQSYYPCFLLKVYRLQLTSVPVMRFLHCRAIITAVTVNPNVRTLDTTAAKLN